MTVKLTHILIWPLPDCASSLSVRIDNKINCSFQPKRQEWPRPKKKKKKRKIEVMDIA